MDLPLPDDLLKGLLYEDEGSTLDFKREAYLFEGAADRQKAELLKDTLAFANAFRQTTAYILIGVEDVPGGRGVVHGVERHPDDAALQQFVNSKTNRPVEFRYRAREVDGRQVGIIEIPVQTRPFYLLKPYGGLHPQAVYVRRGSSTGIASPDEVARMGEVPSPPTPDLSVSFGHSETDARFDDVLSAGCRDFILPDRIPDYRPGGYGPARAIYAALTNPNFYREFAAHCRDAYRLHDIQVAVDNSGGSPLIAGRVVVRAPRGTGLLVARDEAPEPSSSPTARLTFRPVKPDWTVTSRGDAWEAYYDVGTVYPGGSVWTERVLVGATKTGEYPVDLLIYGENLQTPIRRTVTVHFDVQTIDLPLNRLQEWASGAPPVDLLTQPFDPY